MGQVSRVDTLPAPIGGWNARDPLSAMKKTDAVTLRNFVPGTGGVALRGGSVRWATGMPASVRSLMRYNPPSGGAKLFAAAAGNIYDVTSGGAVGAPVQSGGASDLWSSVNFGTAGGNFLVCCNGSDAPRRSDGSTWTNLSLVHITADGYTLDPTKFTSVWTFAFRLWFTEKDSLRAWYNPVYQLDTTGATTAQTQTNCFDLSSIFRLGGSLVAVADWTRDGGTGSDDYCVFLTSEGEVALFSGTNPNDASNWTFVGLFRIPQPIGRRCVLKDGADLAILTAQGVVPLSRILPLALSETAQISITDKIKGAFVAAFQSAGALTGWQMFEYPRGGLVGVNVPQSDGSFQQYVMNTSTGAWTQFTGLAATCWDLLNNNPMFGSSDGSVWQFDVGNQDDGKPIEYVSLSAFQNFKTEYRKKFEMARPIYTGPLGYRPALALRIDYDTSSQSLSQAAIPDGGATWDVSAWDTSSWGAPTGTVAKWQSVRGVGSVASVLLSGAGSAPITLQNIDVMFQVAGPL